MPESVQYFCGIGKGVTMPVFAPLALICRMYPYDEQRVILFNSEFR